MSANALTTIKPLINTGIHQYVGKDSPLIRSKAKSLALNALQSYNPHTGPLRPHLMSNLQGLNTSIRTDHFLLNRTVAKKLKLGGVDREVRDGEKTSDDAPTWIQTET